MIENPALSTGWLQYGAFGLLAFLLVFGGRYLIKRDAASQAFQFNLLTGAEARQERTFEAWLNMSKDFQSAQLKIIQHLEALQGQSVEIAQHQTEAFLSIAKVFEEHDVSTQERDDLLIAILKSLAEDKGIPDLTREGTGGA